MLLSLSFGIIYEPFCIACGSKAIDPKIIHIDCEYVGHGISNTAQDD